MVYVCHAHAPVKKETIQTRYFVIVNHLQPVLSTVYNSYCQYTITSTLGLHLSGNRILHWL